jgi:hypothetical protein
MYPDAIQTKFHGITYKSRQEARWAVFFESLGIPYEYEAEGFELSVGRYLPDFYLPNQDYIIEIKGGRPSEQALEKAALVSEETQKEVFLFSDIPNPSASEGILESPAYRWNEKERIDCVHDKANQHEYDYFWTECPNNCSLGFGITKYGRADLLSCNCFDDFYRTLVNRTFTVFTAEELRLLWQWLTYRFDSNLLCRAYDNARSASFDKTGNAFLDKNYTPVKFWADGPSRLDDENRRIVLLVHDIHDASSRDPLLEKKLHDELAKFMLGRIDWHKIRVINRLLKPYDDEG